MGDAIDIHGDGVVQAADGVESDVAWDIHDAAGAADDGVGGGKGGEGIDDEGDAQHRGKTEPKVGWEVLRASPILVDGLPCLDQCGIEIPNYPGVELIVHSEEVFEEEAVVVAAVVDHIAAQDLSMGGDDVRSVHNIGVHKLLHEHKPPRSSRK